MSINNSTTNSTSSATPIRLRITPAGGWGVGGEKGGGKAERGDASGGGGELGGGPSLTGMLGGKSGVTDFGRSDMTSILLIMFRFYFSLLFFGHLWSCLVIGTYCYVQFWCFSFFFQSRFVTFRHTFVLFLSVFQ